MRCPVSRSVFKSLHWKTLMLERAPQFRVDMLTKGSNRGLWGRLEDQRDDAGDHPRNQLDLWTYAPAHREIEHDIALDVVLAY
ncbi:hypothetical protein AU190_20745 [Mycolicibacterium acapulense]|nr:hypothetical protein AU189_24530 [Mycolicibacterium acapulense]KUI10539.1 hypothetical protein AU190_20745 [Mycolicibacterium acapulense]